MRQRCNKKRDSGHLEIDLKLLRSPWVTDTKWLQLHENMKHIQTQKSFKRTGENHGNGWKETAKFSSGVLLIYRRSRRPSCAWGSTVSLYLPFIACYYFKKHWTMTVSQSQTSALCNCRNTEVCCPTGKSPYAGGMRKAVLPELGSSYHSIFYGFTLMMFCSVLSGKYYMLETIPVVGSRAQTWGVPVWSGPVLAAHLSSCFPPLVKEIKCCAYLCRRVSFSGWEVSETIYPTDFYREKQTAEIRQDCIPHYLYILLLLNLTLSLFTDAIYCESFTENEMPIILRF